MRSSERGTTAIIVAIVLAVLCGFAALALDVGHLLSVRGELQNGADSAAIAGAKRLSGSNKHYELAMAKADAENYARNHPTDLYDVEPTQIELGAWVPVETACSKVGGTRTAGSDTHQFCSIGGATEEDAANVNAVRVVTKRTGSPGEAGGGAVPLAFGAFVGKSGPQEVSAEAIAVTGGPCSQACPDLPIAIQAHCLYDGGRIRCDSSGVGAVYYVGLSSAPEDTAGLTSLSGSVPASADAICDVLRRDDDCPSLENGEPINVQDGNSWQKACDPGCPYQAYGSTGDDGGGGVKDKTCEVIRRRADRDCDGRVDDENGDGVPDYTAQIPVIQYEGSQSCGDHPYNQSAKVLGWATVAIVSARCESLKKLPAGAVPVTKLCDDYGIARGEDFSASTCVAIQLYCNQEDDETSRVGCGWFGTAAPIPALVR